MPDIFLSYSREDLPTARRFAEGFEREGLTVWWDQSLDAGQAFDEVTENALNEAKAAVVLWSKQSVASRWVRAEATQANDRRTLCPVMIEPCRRPIMFELTHTADLIGWEGDAADERWLVFIDGLRKLISQNDASTIDSAGVRPAARRPPRKRVTRPVVAAIAALALIAGAAAAWVLAGRFGTPPSVGAIHVSLSFSSVPAFMPTGLRHLAISADGSAVAFSSGNALSIRSLRSGVSTTLDTACPNPFFSPDSVWVGCIGGELLNLLKIPVSGGAHVQIAPITERVAGASWGRDGRIIFATTEGLFRIGQDGGKPELLAAPRRDRGELLYAWPELLPGGRAVLFTMHPQDLDAAPRIMQLDLQDHSIQEVLAGGSGARYSPTGHLVYAVGEKLRAIRFDPESGRTQGAAVQVPDMLVATTLDNGAADFALSANGTLVSVAPRPTAGGGTQLFWHGRSGKRASLGLEPNSYLYPRISPDARHIVLEINNGKNRDLWMWDPRRTSLTPLTTGPSEDFLATWSSDGQRVFFSSNRSGTIDVYSQAADGASDARAEFTGPGAQIALMLTPDGRQVIVFEDFKTLNILELEQHTLRPLPRIDAEVGLAAVSPDGRWIAYESKESGKQTEIYLRPYPAMEARREKISIDGGRYPLWSRTGTDELFYVDLKGAMMSAEVKLKPELQLGKVTKLFDWTAPPPGVTGQMYDISPADGRFLLPVPSTEASEANRATQVSVVLNWFDELRRLAP